MSTPLSSALTTTVPAAPPRAKAVTVEPQPKVVTEEGLLRLAEVQGTEEELLRLAVVATECLHQ